MQVRPYGDSAVLAEVGDTAAVLALRDALDGAPGVVELVPGARTLLVRYAASVTADRVRDLLLATETGMSRPAEQTAVQLHVHYDGADLAELADELGLGVEEIVARHTAATYRVAFCGFSPGFAYLTGLDPVLHAARLAEPRTAVPAGSVAIGGEFTGVYPRSSPGGWRLLGRTEAPLWDASRPSPALLRPGTSVRFVAS